ncbi:putative disease resistance protein At3g14460 isoform X1 [Arachis stenosperma]|nr:putative disease resistance protein At3g14460 isoform X1 [Arachis stenosperma]XP_057744235.1 putative disease resistance protein At3g14460 isoform X1 [Arachis stenosperma]XP_057744236.1 putative disease resistance protein At3g14460 isoform X1 [Arachis stenosperma]XP_057744237.1 putative disease resistance protein At3g14460 isoform X1 [Arachis stenosperma]XP_057744238.1 putative disease resistance protein At3g14460 isoform X1 [Arachis stenosperma]XP_057744239.1 putative disease resistance pr
MFCAGVFYVRGHELGNGAMIDSKTRHVSFDVEGNFAVKKFLEACDNLKYPRTFLMDFLPLSQFSKEIAPSIWRLLSKLERLRVLSFGRFPLESLANSIDKLIHLRYLDLSESSIKILPESLGNLYNLQTLKLRNCRRLEMLPSSMQHLVNLRHLDVRGTNLKEMPKGMSRLKQLQFLSSFVVGRNEENGIMELGGLASIHGSLTIAKIENVINPSEARMARMPEKKHINILKLRWLSDNSIDSQNEREILAELQPQTNLKELSIKGYRGTRFPEWIGHSCYQYMTDLKLKGCSNCCMLPSLGQLVSLKHLNISDFDSLETIGEDFYMDHSAHSSCIEPFPSLESLIFNYMPSWKIWHSFEFAVFPRLKELEIWECPMLVGDFPHHLRSLEKLTIFECNNLACSLPRGPAIRELLIDGKQNVRMQELPPSLLSLAIFGSQQVESVLEAITHNQPTCLQFLHIESCPLAISFPGTCLPHSLKRLEIYDCTKLEFPMQQQHNWLQSLEICDSCDSMSSFPLVVFPNVTKLSITRCKNMRSLEVSPSHDVVFPCLRDLTICGCPNFVSLLSQTWNNEFSSLQNLTVPTLPSLHQLTISCCASFVFFSAIRLAAPQLEHLKIHFCPEVDSFQDLPPKLRDLQIEGCEKAVRCLASSTILQSSSLIFLLIRGACESVKSFPREGCLPVSLESLQLDGFPSLETLDCNGLLHLTSLKTLSINDCPNLKNMAGERLPASLAKLSINGCPLLSKFFQTKDPLVWPKISLIHKIEVDDRQIS